MTAHKQHSPGFLAIVDDAKSRIQEISVHDTLSAIAGDARLLDVREDHEWTACHALGAEHLGKGVIERDIETLVPDKDDYLILYCGGGFRAALAADSLRKMGYTNVCSMAGGWRAWLEAGAPIEEGEGEGETT